MNKILNELALKYDLVLDNRTNNNLILVIKSTDIIALVENKNNEIKFYDLDFFKTEDLKLIGKANDLVGIEKLLFNSLIAKKTIKRTTTNLEIIKNYENKVKFSYSTVAALISKELFESKVKMSFINVIKLIDKKNKTITIKFYDKQKDAFELKNNNVLTFVFDVDGLFNKRIKFLSKTMLNAETSVMKNKFNNFMKYIVSADYETNINNFVDVYLKKKNKFIMDDKK